MACLKQAYSRKINDLDKRYNCLHLCRANSNAHFLGQNTDMTSHDQGCLKSESHSV